MNILKNNLASILLFAFTFLLINLYLPFNIAGLLNTKIVLLVVFTLVASLVFVVKQLKRDEVNVPINLLTLSVVLVPIVSIISALFSYSPKLSFFGRDFDFDGAFSLLILFTSLIVATFYFTKKKAQDSFFNFLTVSYLFAAFIQVAFMLFPILRVHIGFPINVATVVGAWNNLAVLSALILVISAINLDLFKLAKKVKWLYVAGLIVSILFLIITNVQILWVVLALVSVAYFIYLMTEKISGSSNSFPTFNLVILILSIIFLISGYSISDKFAKYTQVFYSDVRPQIGVTTDLFVKSVNENVVLGSGPVTFLNQINLYKDTSANQEDFWNIDFRYGYGNILTYIASTGILGLLSWLFFIGMYLYYGAKSLAYKEFDGKERSKVVSVFVSSLFLWVISIIYVVGPVLIILQFMLTGIFFGILYQNGILKLKTYALKENRLVSFLYILFSIILIVGITLVAFNFSNRFSADYNYRQASVYLSLGQDEAAQRSIETALNKNGIDTYYNLLTDINLYRINQLVNSGSDFSNQSVADSFRRILSSVFASANASITYDPKSYRNILRLADINRDLAILDVRELIEPANNLYDRAISLNPNNPLPYLSKAQLSLADSDRNGFTQNINKALELKNNYLDALVALSKYNLNLGNTDEAVAILETATVLRPNDPLAYFQLGALRYDLSRYDGAVSALESALVRDPVSFNVKYLLGLSYYFNDQDEQALAQFKDLNVLYPGNQQILQIIKNLNSGLSPLYGIANQNIVAPTDSESETDAELGTEEDSAESDSTDSTTESN